MRIIKYSIWCMLMTVFGMQSYVDATKQATNILDMYTTKDTLTLQEQQTAGRLLRGLKRQIGDEKVKKYEDQLVQKKVTSAPLPQRLPAQTQPEPQQQQVVAQPDSDQIKRLQEEVASLKVSLQTKEVAYTSREQELQKELEGQRKLLQQKNVDEQLIVRKETEEKQKAIKDATEYKGRLEAVQKELEGNKQALQNAISEQSAIRTEKERLIQENRDLEAKKTKEIESQSKTIESYQQSLAECKSKVDKMGGFNANAASWQVIEQVVGNENMKNIDSAIKKYSEGKDQGQQADVLYTIRNQFSLAKLNPSTNAYQEYKSLLGDKGLTKIRDLEQKNRESETKIKALEQEKETNKKKIQELEQKHQGGEDTSKKELEDYKQQLAVEKDNVVKKQQKINELEGKAAELQAELGSTKQMGATSSTKMQELEQKNRESEITIKALEQEKEISKKKIQELEQKQREGEDTSKKQLEDCKKALEAEKSNVETKQKKISETEEKVKELQKELKQNKPSDKVPPIVTGGVSSSQSIEGRAEEFIKKNKDVNEGDEWTKEFIRRNAQILFIDTMKKESNEQAVVSKWVKDFSNQLQQHLEKNEDIESFLEWLYELLIKNSN